MMTEPIGIPFLSAVAARFVLLTAIIATGTASARGQEGS